MKPLTPKMREALERLAQECRGEEVREYPKLPGHYQTVYGLCQRGLIWGNWTWPSQGRQVYRISVRNAGRKALESEDA